MTADDRFRIDLEQLDEAISTMEKFGVEVEQWLADVERRISDLHLSWASEAATAQRAAHDKWVVGVDEMQENLDELREVARIAHTNYTRAITHNTGMWP